MHVPARLGALSATAVLSLALAACGSGSSDTGSTCGMHHGSSSSTSSPSASTSASTSAPVDAQHDAADVTFSQGMVVHHQGAIRLAEMATAQASTP